MGGGREGGGREIAAGIDEEAQKASKQKVNVAASKQFSTVVGFCFCFCFFPALEINNEFIKMS